MKDAASVLDCLAAGYRLDLDDAEYVRNLAQEATGLLDRGLGVIAYTYDAHDPTNPTIEQFAVSDRFDPAWLPPFYAALESRGLDGASNRPSGFAAWGHMTCGQATAVPGMRPLLPAFAHIGGARDTLAVNALDADGRGLWLGAPMRSTRRATAQHMTLLSRLSAHLTAASRIRRRDVGAREPAAVLSADGAMLHATGTTPGRHREELRHAVTAFDKARTRRARRDVESATRRWRPLVASTWSLLDEFDTDGKRFVVAVENTPPTRAWQGSLSEREQHVLTQASLGHSNKEIAYELGLSHATVRVLFHRAARKLRTSTRAETIARFAALGVKFTPRR
jgi:DNA-binding CsgD family transcriptional regulator